MPAVPEPRHRGDKRGDDDGDEREPAASCIVSALRLTSCVWVPLVVLALVVRPCIMYLGMPITRTRRVQTQH